MKKDELIKRLKDIEWDDFEVKKAKNELPKNIWETVSAFSNTSGGWIVLGVAQQGKEFEIIGIENAEKLEQDFFSAMRSQKFNAVLSAKVNKYEIDGKRVLAFFVPSSLQKPVYYNNPTNTFIRCGSGDQRATNDEISAMFREQSFGIRSELAIPDTHIGQLNQESLQNYRNFLNVFNLLTAYSLLDDSLFCKKVGITDENGLLTYAGLLMFGRSEIIHRHVPTFWMDLVEIPGNSVQEAKTRYSYRIPEQENLWEYYHVIIKRLRLLVETPFQMNEDGVAVDDDSQFSVLREALVNMLMHTDHFSPVHSCIRVYTNRIEFMNAGAFPVPVEQLGKVMISKPRNPTIAKLFRFAKLAETVGFGIDKLKSWEKLTGNDVTINGEIEYVCLTFGLVRQHKTIKESGQIMNEHESVHENVADVVENVVENVVDDVHNNVYDNVHNNVHNNVHERLNKILDIILKNKNISIPQLANQLNVTPKTVYRDLSKLKDMKFIDRAGSNKGGYWLILRQEEKQS